MLSLCLLLLGSKAANSSTITTVKSSGAKTTCFDFFPNQSPYGETQFRPADENFVETWCYQGDKNETYVFNADNASLNQNLIARVELSKDGRAEFVTVIANVKGKQTMHKSPASSFSPIGVPLTVAEAREIGKQVLTPQLSHTFDDIFSLFSNDKIAAASISTQSLYRVRAGQFKKNLSSDLLPWDSDYYPFGKSIINILGIFDRFMKNRFSLSSHAQAWERRAHKAGHLNGHCNGWAAASILHPEPTQVSYSQLLEAEITPYTTKGILSSTSFCVRWAFYGKRYYGNDNDDPRDINPAKFHKVLLYYINQQNKPVVMDHMADAYVDNSVISGYVFDIQKLSANTFHVTAKLKVHYYNYGSGVAPHVTVIYNYTLTTDANRRIIAGTWDDDSKNPDFLWVPLAQIDCGKQNPWMTMNRVNAFLSYIGENFSISNRSR